MDKRVNNTGKMGNPGGGRKKAGDIKILQAMWLGDEYTLDKTLLKNKEAGAYHFYQKVLAGDVKALGLRAMNKHSTPQNRLSQANPGRHVCFKPRHFFCFSENYKKSRNITGGSTSIAM